MSSPLRELRPVIVERVEGAFVPSEEVAEEEGKDLRASRVVSFGAAEADLRGLTFAVLSVGIRAS